MARHMGTKGEPKSGLCPRISFSPSLGSPTSCSHLFFPHRFYPSPPTSIFFSPENQFEARCNARYRGAPGRRSRHRTSCGQEARNFVKRVRDITKRLGPAALRFHAGEKTDARKKGVNDGPERKGIYIYIPFALRIQRGVEEVGTFLRIAYTS